MFKDNRESDFADKQADLNLSYTCRKLSFQETSTVVYLKLRTL